MSHDPPVFGYRPNPLFATHGARAIDLSGEALDLVESEVPIDLTQWAPPGNFQGPMGRCTAHGGCAAVEGLIAMASRDGLWGGKTMELSRLAVYQRTLDAAGHRGVDQGASGTEMCRVLARGFPDVKKWPDSDVLGYDLPPPDVWTPRRLIAWRQVPHSRRGVRSALALACPVVIGIPVFNGENGMGSAHSYATGEVREPASGDAIVGWHMVTLWSHVPETRSFAVQNWWRGWGDERGLGTIPEDYVFGRANEILALEAVR